MIDSSNLGRRCLAVFLTSASLLVLPVAASATEQAQQRQQGRSANQAAKQQARQDKVDCRAANQQSNAECRQDKRDTKQDERLDGGDKDSGTEGGSG